MALELGTAAPDFTLPSTGGTEVRLSALRGKKVVLYFYPKDDTPGCTVEACDFRDNLARVQAAGAVLFGVSKDSLALHEKFRAKFGLPFPLLSDAGNTVARAYGAYGQKMMYGRAVEGTIRSTFIIDAQGVISQVWSPVKVAGHADKVLEALHGVPAASATEAEAKKMAPARKEVTSKKMVTSKKEAAGEKKAALQKRAAIKKAPASRAKGPSRKKAGKPARK